MQMQFHPEKCMVLHLSWSNPNLPYTMTSVDSAPHPLTTTDEEKDVGVLTMNWNSLTTSKFKLTKPTRWFAWLCIHWKHWIKKLLLTCIKIWFDPTWNMLQRCGVLNWKKTKLVSGLALFSTPGDLPNLNFPHYNSADCGPTSSEPLKYWRT